MIKRLATLLGVSGIFVAAIVVAVLSGKVSDAVAIWLYPALVALLFVVLGVAAFFFRMRPLLWLSIAGVVGQFLGWALIFLDHIDLWWRGVLFGLLVPLVVGLVMALVWLVVTLRARWLERRMIEGVGAAPGASEQEVRAVREGMAEALRLLQRAGKGRQAIYMLPWYLVMGRPQAGKTIAIKNSGLGLPVRRDWVKGVGGTRTCDWFFTNDMVFLDTPGRWVMEGTDKADREYWTALLDLLRKHRGRRPLDGLVVVVPAEDLLGKSEKQVQEQAGKIREVVDLMQERLRFRIPVYLIISKADLVGGFVEFFRGLPGQRRNEILGWSHTEPDRGEPTALIAKGMDRIVKRLHAYRLEMIARVGSRTRARRLFFFPEEFRRLSDPLVAFAEVFFSKDRYHEAPVFRGFYFTSGTQGEGTTLSRAMVELASRLGVHPSTSKGAPEAEEEPKRSYFLLDLFRDLMLRDEGLVGRTAGHWLRRRRGTMVGAFLPAGLALGFALLCALGLFANQRLATTMKTTVPPVARTLQDAAADPQLADIEKILAMTGELRDLHRSATGFSIWRGYGMRRGLRESGGAAEQTFTVLREGFSQAVLRPLLDRAEAVASGSASGAEDAATMRSCADRMQILSSVVWLRMARRAQAEDELSGLDLVWTIPDEDRSADARRELLRQFRYIEQRLPAGESFLPGFSVDRVARAIVDDCSTLGSGSALGKYWDFLRSCSEGAVSPEDVQRCYGRLEAAIDHEEQDYGLFSRRLQELKADLLGLAGEVGGATTALEAIESISDVEAERATCIARFDDEIAGKIENYVRAQEAMITTCQQEVELISDWLEKRRKRGEILKEQADDLDSSNRELAESFRVYERECEGRMLPGMTSLEASTLFATMERYRRWMCLPEEAAVAYRPATPSPRPTSRPPSAVRLQWFRGLPGVAAEFTEAGLGAKLAEWSERAAMADGQGGDLRAYENQQIQADVASYAPRFASAWRTYLGRARLVALSNPANDLSALANAKSEYERVLRPAAGAMQAALNAPGSYAAPLRNAVGGLTGLDRFVEGGLGEYLRLIGDVGRDLQTCRSDIAFCQTIRARISRGDADSPLIAAERWVDANAGPGLAGGELDDLLRTPLLAARQHFSSGDQVRAEWEGLQGLWSGSLQGRFPFSGNPEDPAAELADIVRIFGRASGFVPSLAKVAAEGKLSPEAQAWLRDADALSRALFREGSDEPRASQVDLKLTGYSLTPEKDAEKLKVDKIEIYLGSDDGSMLWAKEKDGPTKSKTLRFHLIGNEAAQDAYVQAFGADKKPFLKSVFGSNYKKASDRMMTSYSGAFAPLALLREGSPSGAGTLSFSSKIPVSRSKEVTLEVKYEASGEDAGALLRVAATGMPAPPSNGVRN